MAPGYICHIYGIWNFEGQRWHLGWQCKPQVGDEPILVEKVMVVVKGVPTL